MRERRTRREDPDEPAGADGVQVQGERGTGWACPAGVQGSFGRLPPGLPVRFQVYARLIGRASR